MITGAIINGQYVKDFTKLKSDVNNVTYKNYMQDKQRQDHAAELIQPYANGKPNPDFIQIYPEEAKSYGFN
jgi:hypothetical protein